VLPAGLWTWRDPRSYRHQWLPQPQGLKSGRCHIEDHEAGLETIDHLGSLLFPVHIIHRTDTVVKNYSFLNYR